MTSITTKLLAIDHRLKSLDPRTYNRWLVVPSCIVITLMLPSLLGSGLGVLPLRPSIHALVAVGDEDELFYLRTRGIPRITQRLVVTGFLDEVIQRLHQPAIGDHLHRLIEEKFAKV